MAFDQTTRNRLNRFVADSRGLLATEFTRQLQATYGMNPATGDVTDISSLAGLTPHQQETAQLLRDTFEHYLAANDHAKGKSKEKESRLAALDRIVREQAFTVLNRLAALRMSEARGFLTESLANGYDSKGFQLFHRIAGTSLGETGEAYTHYLFSIFDEFALDLSVLFDRFAAQGRLFPSTPVLLELLALINDDEVAPLWAEDETIGWIYQYFNSQEERKKMRDASQAPRNSRELAVRNQFFTPRYVVEFLTDNTLGRVWYEMTKGQTKLIDECEYLVKRPNEIFLNEGEQAPELDSTEGLSQEELLQQTVYIEHRMLKDPRDIKMLDPACGSMHFGLYCFDLFECIYEEAWDIESAQGADCFARENNQEPLTQSYSGKAEFLTHVPRLIIENNIHGVDIDPRAAQVAGMSLWQRAHNSWQKAGAKPQIRPQITKSNIVCAEPMPGEKELLQEFSSQLKPTVLGQLVEVIFEKMQLAGEAGTLLKIEKEIEDAIAGAKAVWQQQNQALSQFPDLVKVAKRQNEGKGEVDFDVSDIDDEGFWQQAEQKILDTLAAYASSTSADMNEQKRLFASDAAKGFAFIDLCKKRFDVVLMNPPFGEPAQKSKVYINKTYCDSKNDLYASFVDRGLSNLIDNGVLGAITNKTGFFLQTFESWRRLISSGNNSLHLAFDLGFGVLDTAMVETMAYIINKGEISSPKTTFIRAVNAKDKESLLSKSIENNLIAPGVVWQRSVEDFECIPFKPLCYWVTTSFIELFKSLPAFSPSVGHIYQGIATGDNFRFLRNRWEVPESENLDGWPGYVKGGTSSKWYSPIKLALNWKWEGKEVKANAAQCYGSASRTIKNEVAFFKAGATYTQVTVKGFSARAMPSGCIFDMKGPYVEFGNIDKYLGIGVMSSLPFKSLTRLVTDNRQWHPTNIMRIPFPTLEECFADEIVLIVKKLVELSSIQFQADETSGIFKSPSLNKNNVTDDISHLELELDALVANAYGVKLSEFRELNSLFEDSLLESDIEEAVDDKIGCQDYKHYSFILGCFFGRWNKGELHDDFNPFRLPVKLSHDPEYSSKNNVLGVHNEHELENFIDFNERQKFIEAISNKSFFDFHLDKYSNSRRQAPIYWPISTTSSSFTLWLYYHRLNDQTLLKCINDAVEPNLLNVSKEIQTLESTTSPKSKALLEKLISLKDELEIYHDELLRLSKFWQPNLNDGVQITAAPLWRLFQHKAWQKKLKQTWEKLQGGEYDWAHLAFSTWPERVLKKCHEDRSLAIAHDVEDDLWHEVEVIKGRKKEPVWEWQPKPLTDAELHTYIREKIAKDDRLKLYRSNQSANANGGAL